jgi:hypothetical protein
LKLIIILLTIVLSYGESHRFLITDADFNLKISKNTLTKFCKSYKYNLFTPEDISDIYDSAKLYNINPLIVLLKMEQENALVRNYQYTNNYQIRYFRACAYGLSPHWSSRVNSNYIQGILETNWTLGTNTMGRVRYYRHGGFQKQVSNCARILRRDYNKWNSNKTHVIKDSTPYITTTFDNAATYALFVYCPYYAEYDNYGFPRVGNRIIHKLWKQFKDTLNKVK